MFNRTIKMPLLTWQNQSKDATSPPFEEFVKTGFLPAENYSMANNIAPGSYINS